MDADQVLAFRLARSGLAAFGERAGLARPHARRRWDEVSAEARRVAAVRGAARADVNVS